MEKKSLLMWIVPPAELDNVVEKIKDIWKPEGSIFVFAHRYDIPPKEFYITWNTTYHFRMPGVIRINRKGTTLFTIDAINVLSIEENGEIVKEWSPNWNEFENQILLTTKEGLINQIPTVVYDNIKK